MPYREDLDAALARVNACEEELNAARREHQIDRTRVAELEAALAAAKHAERVNRASTRAASSSRPLPEASPGVRWPLVLGAVLVLGGAAAFGLALMARSTPVASSTIDVSGALPAAQTVARRTAPDMVLQRLRADNVGLEGSEHFVTSLSRVDYRFVSLTQGRNASPTVLETRESLGASPPSSTDSPCLIDVEYRSSGMRSQVVASRGDASCREALPEAPRCMVVDVWKAALRKGAPTNALASLRLEMSDYQAPGTTSYERAPVWTFTISGANTSGFTMKMLDRCTSVP